MKILFVIDGLGTGGAERSLAEMLPGLRAADFEPIVVCLYPRAEGIESHVRGMGFDVRVLPTSSFVGRVAALRRLILDERPALVHSSIFESNVAARVAVTATDPVLLNSLVNVAYPKARLRDPHVRSWRIAVVKGVDGWTARHVVDHFHAVTHAVKHSWITRMGLSPDRITVIHRGRDPLRLGAPSAERRRRAREELGLSPAQPVLINVGRQEYQKGQWVLVHAVKKLLHRHPDLVLLVAGRNGQMSTELERLRARDRLEDRVRLLGHRDDVPELLAASDVFVFPSLWEGLGGSVLEAMALGLPIVASDLESVREVVDEGRNADLVPPDDVDELATAIDAILGDPDRARSYGQASRHMFEARYTLDRTTRAMISLYESLIGGHDHGRAGRSRRRKWARGPSEGREAAAAREG